jgi:hypothetical protein
MNLIYSMWPNLVALALVLWAAFYGSPGRFRKRVTTTSITCAILLLLVYSWQWGIDYRSLSGVDLGDAVALLVVLPLFFAAVLGAVYFGVSRGLPRPRSIVLTSCAGVLVTLVSPVLGIYVSCFVGRDCL